MQAEAWGVELRPRRRWDKENKALAIFSVKHDPDGEVLRQLVSETLGAKYDWSAAGMVGVLGWVRRWVRARFPLRPSRSPGRLMCAELVTRYLHKMDLAKHLDEETTSPLELLMWAANGGLHGKWRSPDLRLPSCTK